MPKKKETVKPSRWLSVAPAYWFLLLGFTGLVEYSEWSSSEGPPYVLSILINILLFAPIMGIVGIIHINKHKSLYKQHAEKTLFLLYAALIGIGIVFSAWWYL